MQCMSAFFFLLLNKFCQVFLNFKIMQLVNLLKCLEPFLLFSDSHCKYNSIRYQSIFIINPEHIKKAKFYLKRPKFIFKKKLTEKIRKMPFGVTFLFHVPFFSLSLFWIIPCKKLIKNWFVYVFNWFMLNPLPVRLFFHKNLEIW